MSKGLNSSAVKNLMVSGWFLMAAITTPLLATPEAPSFPFEKLNNLPFLYFHEVNQNEANLFRMRKEESMLVHDGHHYIGFQFWSAYWTDGPIEWLMVSTPGSDIPGPWLLINANGEVISSSDPQSGDLDRYLGVRTRYPRASAVTYYRTPEVLERKSHYYLLQPVDHARPSQFAVAFTIASKRGHKEFGHLNVRPNSDQLRHTADVIVEDMKDIRRNEGDQQAMAYLTRELEQRMDQLEANPASVDDKTYQSANIAYYDLFNSAWKDAQFNGRTDKEWACTVYDTLVKVTHRRGYHSHSMDAACNAAINMSSLGRYGQLSELLESWKTGMEQGGFRMDPSSYPDLGPAIEVLPVVRIRDIPELTPYAKADNRHGHIKTIPPGLTDNIIITLENYSYQQWYKGEWKQALEWFAWARHLSTDPDTGGPKRTKSNVWHQSTEHLSSCLSALGFKRHALQLLQQALQEEYDGWYMGRFTTMHQLHSIDLTLAIDDPLPDGVETTIKQLIEDARGNQYLSDDSVKFGKTLLAMIHIHNGLVTEGEALLDELVATGSIHARNKRLDHWIASHRNDAVESELLDLLNQSRNHGHKFEEIRLYRLYADFLEHAGRLDESLVIRRETIRLCHAFDYFTLLPQEIAKLAVLLHRIGAYHESMAAAEEANRLLATDHLPAHLRKSALTILHAIPSGNTADTSPDQDAPRVDMQPIQSMIIANQSVKWTSHLTLTNPTKHIRSGRLSAVGSPVSFSVNSESGDIQAIIGGTSEQAPLPVKIDPGNYLLVSLTAADGYDATGQLAITWLPDDGNRSLTTQLEISDDVQSPSSSVIEAGAYQMNPFYGVPVYHQYLNTTNDEYSLLLRFVCSQTARVEVYALDGSPIAIDSMGNGSLHDQGDELFSHSDGNGNLRLELTQGTSTFMLMVYPKQKLTGDGLQVRTEALENGQWTLHAQDLLVPTPAD